jgi:hypothetical protein
VIRAIAYRMQEIAYGGLSKATQRKLDALAKELKSKGNARCHHLTRRRLAGIEAVLRQCRDPCGTR